MSARTVAASSSLAAALGNGPRERVVVAPDLGAARLADRYGRALDLPVAMVHKTRVTGEEVVVRGVTGDVAGRAPIIVDDMISTGATIAAALAALREAGCRPQFTVVASHALLVGDAVARLQQLALERVIVTDSVAFPAAAVALPLHVVSVASCAAECIGRLHQDRSLADLLVHC